MLPRVKTVGYFSAASLLPGRYQYGHAMLRTPWGDADGLRAPPVPGGRGSDREAVRREQAERFFTAMVAGCARQGYDALSVDDLVRVSGSSRATFYELFEDKADCFRAAERAIVAELVEIVAARLSGGGDAVGRLRAGLDTFVDLIAAQPAAARMCLVEAYAVEEIGDGPVREAIDRITVLARRAFAKIPDRGPMPPELVQGIIGGIRQVIYQHLLDGRAAELPRLVPALWDWAMSFPPPPVPLRRPKRLLVSRPVPAAAPFASYSVEERMIRGLAAVVADKGYAATKIADIVAAASVSQTTFYEYFDGKDDIFAAALESSGGQLHGAVMPAVGRTKDWRVAARIGLEGICIFLASEPTFAAMRCIEAYAAGPEAIAIRERTGIQVLTDLSGPAFEDRGVELSKLQNEASSGAIYAILQEAVRAGRAAELPHLAPFLTYFALVPLLGPDEATEIANGRARS